MDPQPHPDSNLVSAFLEGVLPELQRRQMVEHLAACGRCRAWAACAHEAGRGRAVRPANRLAGAPVWALATAAALTLVAAGSLGRWHRMEAGTQGPSAPVVRTAAVEAMRAPTVEPPLLTRVAPGARREARAQLRPARGATVGAPFVLEAEATAAPLAIPNAAAPNPVALDTWLSAEIASQGETTPVLPSIDFSPLTTGFLDQPPVRGPRAQLAAWTMPDPYAGSGAGAPTVAGAIAERGADSTAAQTMGATTTAGGEGWSSGFAAPLGSVPLAPHVAAGFGWAISHSGQILRSVGAGMWAAVPLVPGVRFHAVADSGAAVWAGGRVSEVFVSVDRGLSWRRVNLPQDKSRATIAEIAFADAQHGSIVASDGEHWATSDGGANWQVAPPPVF